MTSDKVSSVFCSLLTSPTETLHVLVLADFEAQEDSVYYLNVLNVYDNDNTEFSWTKWRMGVFLEPKAVKKDTMFNDEYDCLPAWMMLIATSHSLIV